MTATPPASRPAQIVVHYFEALSAAAVSPQAAAPEHHTVCEFEAVPLIATAPLAVRLGGRYYPMSRAGLYRFADLDRFELRQSILYRGDLWQLGRHLACLQVHGYRQDRDTPEEWTEHARRGKPLSISCGSMAKFVVGHFTALGVRARAVNSQTMDEWNTYDNGHVLTEVFDPAEKRWVLFDPDIGSRFRENGRLLDLDEACRLYRSGRCPDVEFLCWPGKSDPYPDEGDTADHRAYGRFFNPLLREPDLIRRWYRRILQVPYINGLSTVDTEEQARVMRSHRADYQSLPGEEFRRQVYGE